mmetsp:Transcript_39950/g.63947  ORF Transcript_39950/g.63947 Transcript_39950/m.63947 type:complete len:208 (+) Transcript_39950:239-862(+)
MQRIQLLARFIVLVRPNEHQRHIVQEPYLRRYGANRSQDGLLGDDIQQRVLSGIHLDSTGERLLFPDTLRVLLEQILFIKRGQCDSHQFPDKQRSNRHRDQHICDHLNERDCHFDLELLLIANRTRVDHVDQFQYEIGDLAAKIHEHKDGDHEIRRWRRCIRCVSEYVLLPLHERKIYKRIASGPANTGDRVRSAQPIHAVNRDIGN